MRHHSVRAVVLAAAFALTTALAASAQDFRWHGAVAPGATVEIKGVNGDIVADHAVSSEVEVTAQKRAQRSDPSSVRIEVVPNAGGVTICAVYPSRDADTPNECRPGNEGRMNVQNNDVTVRFTVHVPAGVVFAGRTVNGKVEAIGLNADVSLSTVNGSIKFSTTGSGHATSVNGSIDGEIGRADWSDTLAMKTVNGSITLTLPSNLSTELKATTVNGDISTDFPLTVTGTVSRRRLQGTIGGGGRELSLSTVNGGITLKRG
jgi:putative adhesin